MKKTKIKKLKIEKLEDDEGVCEKHLLFKPCQLCALEEEDKSMVRS